MEEEITNLNNAGDLSTTVGGAGRITTFLNVTVQPDDAANKLMNDGKWCIESQPGQTVHLATGGVYAAFLNGGFLDLENPQPKGKPLEVTFRIFDHKWRSLLDIR